MVRYKRSPGKNNLLITGLTLAIWWLPMNRKITKIKPLPTKFPSIRKQRKEFGLLLDGAWLAISLPLFVCPCYNA